LDCCFHSVQFVLWFGLLFSLISSLVDFHTSNNFVFLYSVKKDDAKQSSGITPDADYHNALPYIPPNETNLRGLTKLMLDHRCLIDQSANYFNVQELRNKLYDIKAKGPNPLLNVLMAMGKTVVSSIYFFTFKKMVLLRILYIKWLNPESSYDNM